MDVQKDVAALYCIYNDYEFLEESIDSIIDYMKRIYLFVSYSRYDGKSSPGDNIKTLRVIDRLINKYKDKIILFRKDWKNQIEQRNEAIAMIQNDGFCYCIVIDADEIYTNGDIRGLLHYGIKFPQVEVFLTHFYTYFKSVKYQIYPVQPLKALTLIKTYVRLTKTRGVKEYIQKLIPQEHVCWHHLSHVRNNDVMYKKLEIAKHEYNINMSWFEDVWLKWTPQTIDFHPSDPQSFHTVKEIDRKDMVPALQRIYDNEKKLLGK